MYWLWWNAEFSSLLVLDLAWLSLGEIFYPQD